MESSHRAFFDHVGRSYQLFLCADDDGCAALDEELAATFQQRDADAHTDVAKLEEVFVATRSIPIAAEQSLKY